MDRFGALFAVLLLAGCASLEDPTARRLEYAYQIAHAIDAAQTASIDECFEEANPITRALIGKHPSDAEVMAWAVGTAWAHGWMSKRLEPWPLAQRIWQITSLSLTVGTVVHNHRIGLRVDGNNKGC